MKLTQVQILELYKFTRAHFVYHYDLQTELVDHLANGIENLREQNPNLTFHEALDKEFKKFGIFGFQDVVTDRAKALSKKYWKIILRFYKEFFSLPKIMLTLLLSVMLFIVLKANPLGYQQYSITSVFFVFLIPSTVKWVKYNRMLKKKERKWMLEELLLANIGILNFIQLPIQLMNIRFEVENTYILILISLASIALLLLFYVMVFIIPPKAEELLSETYPEYKMMQTL
tara:strand:- start:19161 stop:19850 length:690 start_codon:yes stop_codon:yes gene_type:complete